MAITESASAPSVAEPRPQRPPVRDPEGLIQAIAQSCAWRSSVHALAAERWRWWGHVFGYPAALIAALTGVAAFSTLPYASEVTRVLALTVAVLGASNAYFKPKEVAGQHEQAQRAFHALSDEMGQWLVSAGRRRGGSPAASDREREQLRDWSADLARRFAELEEKSPTPPAWAERQLQQQTAADA